MKKGNIMRDVISSSQFTENVIKEYKKGLGDMVLVAITPRTTIELGCALITRDGQEFELKAQGWNPLKEDK